MEYSSSHLDREFKIGSVVFIVLASLMLLADDLENMLSTTRWPASLPAPNAIPCTIVDINDGDGLDEFTGYVVRAAGGGGTRGELICRFLVGMACKNI